ncbi:MAG: GTP 3',8-cyclase MoaA [Methylococcales symbiont of Hymedesmia sp. n. MRB-2018]|nr:MAG: GTP 3',8-cyclase MoaA [Methylococcales symbiont of Hymedesmia sp. n. MRB-2018]
MSLIFVDLMSFSSDTTPLVDRFGRIIDYLRVSITDRCDFRCVYCMSEEMTFLPRAQVLTLEELGFIAKAFTELGVKKIRITGGEPLLRKGVLKLLQEIGEIKALDELVITTNASKLEEMAVAIKEAGVKRVNISLDTLDSEKFKQMTRTGDLNKVLKGIQSAKKAGFDGIKINAVILKNRNHREVIDLVQYAVDNQIDISFIEEMPLGIIAGHDRAEAYYSSDLIRSDISRKFELTAVPDKTGGPSVYYKVKDSQTRVGFISPHSANFCSNCNRVRLTVEGRLLLCLGNEHSVDLKKIIRSNPGNMEKLKENIIKAMQIKPEKHEFNLQEKPVILRYMSATGG